VASVCKGVQEGKRGGGEEGRRGGGRVGGFHGVGLKILG